MSVTDHARRDLFSKLEEVLGTDPAVTLMDHLPPTGWADVARRSDVDHLSEVIGARFEAVDRRFEAVDRRFDELEQRFDLKLDALESRVIGTLYEQLNAQTRLLFFSIIGSTFTAVSLAFAAGNM